MRKFQVIYAILFAAIVGVFSSCNTGDDNVAPVITATPTSVEGQRGTTVAITLGITSSSDLKTISVDAGTYGTGKLSALTSGALKSETEFNSGFGTAGKVELIYSFTISSTLIDGSYTINFNVTDKDGLVATQPVTLTVKAATTPGTLKTNTITLGGQDNTTVGSFAAAFDGTVYKIVDAKANPSKIDIVYYYSVGGSDTKNSLYSATNTDLQGVYSMSATASWNKTEFVAATANDYTNATYASVQALVTGTTMNKIGNLAVDQVYAFKTAGGKYGVLKVTSVASSASGSITFSVKIQDAAPAK